MGMLMETNANTCRDFFSSMISTDSCQMTCEYIQPTLPCEMECFDVPCMPHGILVRNDAMGSWSDHQAIAADLTFPMQLLEPRTEAINDCFKKLLFTPSAPLYPYRFEHYWLGGADTNTEGEWRWASDGGLFWLGGLGGNNFLPGGFDPWCDRNPDNVGNEDCLQTYGYKKCWNDNQCSKHMRAFYELA
eukprot:CAMPEP_0185726864 /NCGR_PEP_ID=MMETSP1171-20130828/2717_1 /TAXON_ID=374046 /ORGANISM="Helicotheca tamensis, Strain CCMP826" /LENGTH=188 /DNA_ID=CAMNT_0028395305 /DNA_START=84 /DNA_END=650 /DNA_ORIENTATION=-